MLLKQRIGTPSLIVCLDRCPPPHLRHTPPILTPQCSGCGNYDSMWITTSLRGLAGGNLKVIAPPNSQDFSAASQY
jgi:hypothetical protein